MYVFYWMCTVHHRFNQYDQIHVTWQVETHAHTITQAGEEALSREREKWPNIKAFLVKVWTLTLKWLLNKSISLNKKVETEIGVSEWVRKC